MSFSNLIFHSSFVLHILVEERDLSSDDATVPKPPDSPKHPVDNGKSLEDEGLFSHKFESRQIHQKGKRLI